jgi:hypothetical protein
VLRVHPLPGEEEAHEVCRADRLDFGTETVEGVTVDTGEQPAVTPLQRGRSPGNDRSKASPQDHALALERCQRDVGVRLRHVEHGCEVARGGRAYNP